ncbi:MAG: FHA domain-containing protein, partial [Verrucomicrobiia bacterium]
MDKLYFLTGPLQGATAELIGDEISVGRALDNDICIDDESLSGHHAVITRQNKECVLRDLQSAKGTTVRGNKIIMVTLEDSDRIA